MVLISDISDWLKCSFIIETYPWNSPELFVRWFCRLCCFWRKRYNNWEMATCWAIFKVMHCHWLYYVICELFQVPLFSWVAIWLGWMVLEYQLGLKVVSVSRSTILPMFIFPKLHFEEFLLDGIWVSTKGFAFWKMIFAAVIFQNYCFNLNNLKKLTHITCPLI